MLFLQMAPHIPKLPYIFDSKKKKKVFQNYTSSKRIITEVNMRMNVKGT